MPGLNRMAARLAGSVSMRFTQFMQLDFVGAAIYTLSCLALGYIARDFLAVILRGFHAAGRAMEAVIVAALISYAIYRVVQYRRHSMYRIVPRVQAQDLARPLPSEGKSNLLIVDVRSHGYYDSGSDPLKASIRI